MEKDHLKIAEKRDLSNKDDDDDDDGGLFNPEMFVTEREKPIEFKFKAADDGFELRFDIYCVDRELQHTASAEGEMVWPAAEVLCWYIFHFRDLFKVCICFCGSVVAHIA